MMYATNKLRFVERVIDKSIDETLVYQQKIKVLQQWWEDRNTDVHWLDGNPGEWRDVPIGEE